METNYRYIKDTIKGNFWECVLVESESGEWKLYTYYRKNWGGDSDETVTDLTEKEAAKYMEKNKEFFVERYVDKTS